ncbi:MAG: transglutaminase-like cysteine peptidase [Maritimibacter sp.]|nr:transglutaminase-like cysteine peptidase [Maritimibacter sp.]
MRQLSADRVRALRAYASALLCAAVTAIAFIASTDGASATNAFIQHKGGAPAPDGAQAICSTYSWACAQAAVQRVSMRDELQQVAAVNSRVNHSVRAIEDDRQYGVSEVWALPTATGGDCEDFALLKKRELISAGVDPRRLLIATVLDRQRNPHAVLVFRSQSGDLVLDNLTDQIRSWQDTRYMFLRMQDPDRPTRWVNVFASG